MITEIREAMMITEIKTNQDRNTYWCKGRNGYFAPRRIEVSTIDYGVAIYVYSQRMDGAPPTVLRLPTPIARKLAQAIEDHTNAKRWRTNANR